MFELWDFKTGRVFVLPGGAQEFNDHIRLFGEGLIDAERSLCIISRHFKVMLWCSNQPIRISLQW